MNKSFQLIGEGDSLAMGMACANTQARGTARSIREVEAVSYQSVVFEN